MLLKDKDMLNIESAEYTLLEGAPALRLTIAGKEAFICDVREPLLKAGFVYLISITPGFQWEDELPTLTLPPTPGLCQTPLPFPGVTDDAGVLRLTREFVDVLNGVDGRRFARGPVLLS